MIPVDELTGVVGNQEFGLHFDVVLEWLRRAVFFGLFDALEWSVSGAVQTSLLRQVQQSAALLPPWLRCQCRSNER